MGKPTPEQIEAARKAAEKLNKQRAETIEEIGRTGDGSYGQDSAYS